MRKILFLLFLPLWVLAQSSTGQEQEFDYGIKNNAAQTVASPDYLTTTGVDGTQGRVLPANLPVSTATTNAMELETTVSAGAVSGFALTNNGNGTVNIASGIAYLRATNDPYATIIKYPISAVTNLALTDNANNYVLVDYNSGSPSITVTTNSSTINTQTNSLAYVITRVGNDLEYLNLVGQNVDPNAKIRIRFLNQEGIRRASGAVLGFSNRNLTLTSSVLFSGLIRINAVAFNTASPDTFTLAYNNGSAWTRTAGQTQVNNTQYNVSGVLTTMPNNTFRTDYVYLLPNNPSKLYVVMGTATFGSLTLAKGAPRPSSLPVELQVLGLEVGRLFIEKNNAAIAEVQSSFSNDFIGAAVPEHNSLTGLQGGAAGEYNHLTNAQVALVNGAEQTTNKSSSYTASSTTTYANTKALVDGLLTKQNTLTNPITGTGTNNQIAAFNGTNTITSLSIGTYPSLTELSYVKGTTSPIQAQLNDKVSSNTATGGYIPVFSFSSIVTNSYLSQNSGIIYHESAVPVYVFSKNTVDVGNIGSSALFTNDNDMLIRASSGNMRFYTGFSEKARFTSGGNFLVNTTTDSGNIGRFAGTVDVNKLQLNTTPATASGTPPLLTWNSSTKDVESVPYTTFANSANSVKLTGESSQTIQSDIVIQGTFTVTDAIVSESSIFGTSVAVLDGTNSQFLKANGTLDSTAYAPLTSPTFTGTPTAPTATAGTNTTQIATTAFVQGELNLRISGTADYIPKFDTANSIEDSSFSISGGVMTYHNTYTVSTLPTPTDTAFAVVTDALAPTYMAMVVGGGAVVCPVFYNGTAWVSH